ncbi:hypothetical protein MKX03_003425, partial [Papaver bracteatum]
GMNGGACQTRTDQAVILRNMRKRCVALGHIDRSRPPPNDEYHLVQIDEYHLVQIDEYHLVQIDEYHLVQIDEVCIESEALCDGDGTFKDFMIGENIFWPQHSVSLIATDGAGF